MGQLNRYVLLRVPSAVSLEIINNSMEQAKEELKKKMCFQRFLCLPEESKTTTAWNKQWGC